ncbi:MAG: PGPGW domain-containing protein [Gammaproteobacteria bacterium]|nr:PGPGW domain-containing protein [Gammaproteobacteria bacterium]NNJ50074.1 hypothetical protein [Gammaproteobacteria bacterium]
MIEIITVFYEEHQFALGIIGGVSAIMFIASILSVPFLVSLIPTDYFQYPDAYSLHHTFKHPVIRFFIISIKNIVGWLLFFAGIIMLILPGQGVVTIIMGLLLVNFPGKRKAEFKLISNQRILRSINWLRAKRNKEPLLTAGLSNE